MPVTNRKIRRHTANGIEPSTLPFLSHAKKTPASSWRSLQATSLMIYRGPPLCQRLPPRWAPYAPRGPGPVWASKICCCSGVSVA